MRLTLHMDRAFHGHYRCEVEKPPLGQVTVSGVPSGQKSKPSSCWISAWLRYRPWRASARLRPLPCHVKIPLRFLTRWATSAPSSQKADKGFRLMGVQAIAYK